MSNHSNHSLKSWLSALPGPSPLEPSSFSQLVCPWVSARLPHPGALFQVSLLLPNTLQSAPTGCWYDTGNDLYEKLRLSPLRRGPPWFPTLVSTVLLLLKLPFHVLLRTFCKQKVFYSFCPFSLPLEYKPLGVIFIFHKKKRILFFTIVSSVPGIQQLLTKVFVKYFMDRSWGTGTGLQMIESES